MEEKKNLLTYEGLQKLENELHDLKVVKRKEVAEKLKEARAQGDLSENADYDVARTQQSELESRIAELEYMLSNAKIIEKKNSNGVVDLGSTVLIEYVDDNGIKVRFVAV